MIEEISSGHPSPKRQPAEHISFLDCFRGLAIVMVFWHHAVKAAFLHGGRPDLPGWRGVLVNLYLSPGDIGWAGVAVFFVISGFCIHLSRARIGQTWKEFFLRRFFRIYPPYLLVVVILVGLYVAGRLFGPGPPDPTSRFLPFGPQLISHVLLVHNFGEQTIYGINNSFWSIAVEVQLYLLYPFVFWIGNRYGWRWVLVGTAVLELTIRGMQMFYPVPVWLDSSPLAYWFSWSLGARLAQAYLQGEQLPFRVPFLLWCLLFLVCQFVGFLNLFWFCFSLAALATVSVFSRLLTNRLLVPSEGWKGAVCNHLRATGVISYSAYLIHQPILNATPKVVGLLTHGRVTPLAMVAICLATWPVVFWVSRYFYRWVELPSIAAGKRVIKNVVAQRPA